MNSRLRELIRQGIDPRLLHWAACPQGGGKGGPPPAPDYRAAAAEQGQANIENLNQQNWANRPEQITPWGRTSWDATAATDPSTGQAVTKWTQNQTLNAQAQSALDQQLNVQSSRSQLAGEQIGRTREGFAQPFDWTNLPATATGPTAGNLQAGNLQAGNLQAGNLQSQSGSLQRSIPQTTQTTNEPAFASERRRIEEGLFQRMRPEHQRQEETSRTMLANQGLTPGSMAYNRELQRLGEVQAGERWNALSQGGSEQARLQQMLLGQQQQAFGQGATAGEFANRASGQAFGQEQAAGAQNFSQQQAAGAQNFSQQQSAGAQNFAQQQAAGAQNFSQQTQAADYQNKLRQQEIAEQAQRRGMSLNEMNALLTGQQVQSPQMPGFSQAGVAAAPNYLGAAQAQGSYNLDANQQKMAGSQALWGDVAGAAGTGAMLFAMSDERLKWNIRRIGTHHLGVGIYEYDAAWGHEVGVIAQEVQKVRPDLVARHSTGFLMVNYGGL